MMVGWGFVLAHQILAVIVEGEGAALGGEFVFCARSDHTTRSRNIKPEVVFKVQNMARYALFCLIMGLSKAEMPIFARLWPDRVR